MEGRPAGRQENIKKVKMNEPSKTHLTIAHAVSWSMNSPMGYHFYTNHLHTLLSESTTMPHGSNADKMPRDIDAQIADALQR